MKGTKIKSFIYLDDYKMYSFSSQLFEGITQYILKEDETSIEDRQEQKGRFLSGMFMADMMFQKNAQTEMRYLHDFAFNLFEKELMDRKMLYDVNSGTSLEELREKGFVRVKGRIIFEDYSKVLYTLDHFNEIGRAIGELESSSINMLLNSLSNTTVQSKDREQNNKAKQNAKRVEHLIDDELKKQGLILEERTKNNIHRILSFGYRDCYEVRLSMNNSSNIYTSIINQEYLKEPEPTIISKYSRLSEKEFTIIGVVSQSGNVKAKVPKIEGNDLKGSVVNIVEHMANLESQFNGRAENECIIDPIAIFTEI